jgi:hypothetical protein
VNGFHFTHFESEEQYVQKLEETAKFYLSQGVTGFWVTIPTVEKEVYMKVNLPPFFLVRNQHDLLVVFNNSLIWGFCKHPV